MTRRLNAPREERLRGVGDNCCHGRVAKCSVRRGGWASSSGKEWLSGGKKWLSCIFEGRSDGKKASSWQDIAEMHAKSANFGKICFLCMLKTGKNAVGEYISRISCPEGPLFLSGALKSCIMSNFCHSFAVPPFARGRTASVVVLGASKRYGRPSRGGASVSLLGGELGKCEPPPSRGGASAVGARPQLQAS